MLKDLLNSLTRSVSSALGGNTSGSSVLNNVINKVTSEAQKKDKTFTFQALPLSVDELRTLPEAALTDAFATAALSVLALTRYETDREECFRMLDFLSRLTILRTLVSTVIFIF